MIKLMIVEDSALFRDLLRSYLEKTMKVEVVATAINPIFAKYKIKKFNPDIIVLDIVMPEVNGIDFLKEIMRDTPMPVIIWSSYVESHNDMYLQAIENGAMDVIYKPATNEKSLLDFHLKQLQYRIFEIAGTINYEKKTQRSIHNRQYIPLIPTNKSFIKSEKGSKLTHIVGIGGSTGAVQGIRQILRELPVNVPPILIVQHMPEKFTKSFAENLNKEVSCRVKEAEDGEFLKNGCAYIARGGVHMEVLQHNGGIQIHYKTGPSVNYSCPSIDVLFYSLSQIRGINCTGILLSGMGLDGARGLLNIRAAGGKTFIQDKKSCAVFGIPKAALDLGACEAETQLSELSHKILGVENESINCR